MNDYNGFIVIHRKMLKWEWYQDTNTKILFLHCLLKANWKDSKFEGIDVPRGSFVTSLPKLSEELSNTKKGNRVILSIQSVRTALNHLILTGEITSTSYPKFRVITVNNYDRYQEYNSIFNRQPTGNQQATNRQANSNRTIYKQSNKETNNNTNNNICDFAEKNFGRTLSPVEYEEISSWDNTELTRYAIKQAVISNKCSIKYISRILFAYGRENIKTVQQAQMREREYAEAKKRNSKNQLYKAPEPDWLNKNVDKMEVTVEQKKQMEKLLEDYR